MKKILFLSTLLAAVLLATSCQKEQELVTLGAVINQPTKTYINDRYPCWNEGDQVYVNTDAYPVSAISGSSAQIADVVGADAYRAIYPATLVTPGSNIANNATIPVTLPATQKYQVVGGHQRVDAPMGAYTEGSTLQFYNLCSIVHVVVNNNTGSDMTLGSLKIEAANAYLSGTGTATVNGTDNDGITLSSDASHAVSLRLSGATNVTLAAGAQSAFDIYVPSFSTDNVTITLTTTNGYYYELPKNGVALNHNTYTTITLNVTSLSQILAAELVNGMTFNATIPMDATAVVFEYNSPVSSGTLLSTNNSPVPIYGNLDGTSWRVSTSASIINANPDCSWMFENKDNLNLIDFGDGFNTYNVTNMRGLFNACGNLSNLDLSYFNTENVTDMGVMFMCCFELTSLNLTNFNTENVKSMDYMFTRCSNLTNLDISKFNTEHVTSMNSMFKNCSSLTSLDLSNFNTENVTDMGAMFEACCNLEYLDVSSFNTENVTCMNSMFALGIEEADKDFVGTKIESNLQILDLSNFNTSNVTDMRFMFSGCGKLTSLNLSNFDMSNVTIIETINEYICYYEFMCYDLSATSGHCTITCSLSVENAIKEIDPDYNPDREWYYSHSNYYISGLPTSGVTFTWVRPTSK